MSCCVLCDDKTDTIAAYPFEQTDPFVLLSTGDTAAPELPDVLFCGNQVSAADTARCISVFGNLSAGHVSIASFYYVVWRGM
jgi:hypothetical protein